MDPNGDERTEWSTSRRQILAASSAAGATMLGYGGVVGSASAEEDGLVSEAEFERILSQSEHIGFKRGARKQVNKDSIDSVNELDTSVTAGPNHPNIYYGEYQNARPPSGRFYDLSEDSDGLDRDLPISVPERRVTKDILDVLTVSASLGSVTVAGYEFSFDVRAGVDIKAKSKGPAFGGELFVDFTINSKYGALTLSPSGFGFYVSVGDKDGLCVTLKTGLPVPAPIKGTIKPCLGVGLVQEGSKVGFKFSFSDFQVCVSGVCANLITTGLVFKTPRLDLDDLLDLIPSQEDPSPEFPVNSI
jgi:hypothetical protein